MMGNNEGLKGSFEVCEAATVSEEDCSRQEAPEQRMTVTKALKFPFCTEKKSSSELERRVLDGVYTERQDGKYGSRVPSKKQKAKVALLESILSVTGSRRNFLRNGVTCSYFFFLFFFFGEKRILLHDFEFFESGTLIRSDVNE